MLERSRECRRDSFTQLSAPVVLLPVGATRSDGPRDISEPLIPFGCITSDMPYSDEELLEDIRAVADVVERSPSLQDYRDHGEIAVTTIIRRFDSWQDAVARAGFEPHNANTKIPEADLLAELQRLADEHGGRPTVETMNEHGEYWTSTYKHRFGSWSAALAEAGFEPADARREPRISEAELIAELRRLANELGEPPTFEEMTERGAYASRTYVDRFGSWSAALEEAFEAGGGRGEGSE